MQGLVYSFKEAWAGFSKARVSTAITIFTIFFLLLVLSVVVMLSLNVQRLVDILNARHDLQVYIGNTLSEKDIFALRTKIAAMEHITAVDYVSKQDAAKEFKSVFGEEVFSLLDENPLPASFIIKLDERAGRDDILRQVIKRLESERGVDEVVSQRAAVDKLVRFSRVSQNTGLVVFSLVLLGSLFMVSNTLRLIIIARKPIIDTMRLVGATRSFIRGPFIIEGVLQGIIGGAAAAAVLWTTFNIINWRWPGVIAAPNELFIGVLVVGFLFGIFGSLFAVKRYL